MSLVREKLNSWDKNEKEIWMTKTTNFWEQLCDSNPRPMDIPDPMGQITK